MTKLIAEIGWNHLHTYETRYDKNTVSYVMSKERTITIDEPIDLELARLLV
jgi:CMP-N-acetylneuraminic acid synthetase